MSLDLHDLLRNHVKELMARDGVVASMTVRLVRTPEIAFLAKAAGFDTLYVDMKHNNFSLESTSQICMAALTVGVTPLVRLASNNPDEISRVLDAGALGVIAPQVRSADDVRRVVTAAKFPPQGERSVNSNVPQLRYQSFPQDGTTTKALNDATLIAINLETKEALESVEDIAEVEGLDLIVIGTNDLMAELGIPGQHDHALVRQAYSRTISACRNAGKYVGVGGLSTRPDLVTEFVRMGARYVSTGYDLAFLLGALTERARRVKEIVL